MSLIYPTMIDTITSPSPIQPRYAPYFDGVTQYGELASSLVFTDGSVLQFKFSVSEFNASVSGALYGPSGDGQFHSRALVNADGSITARVTSFPADSFTTAAGVVKLNAIHSYKLVRTGFFYELFIDNVLVGSATNGSEAAVIGQFANSAKTRPQAVALWDINFNSTTWPMNQRNQAIQPSIPAGNDMTIINHTDAMWRQV